MEKEMGFFGEMDVIADMPKFNDKQVYKCYKAFAWRTPEWNAAVDEMRKRGIRPNGEKVAVNA